MSGTARNMGPWARSGAGDLDFSQAEVQIYGPQAGTLATMRDALRNQGFRKITPHVQFEQLVEGLATAPADMLLLDDDQMPAEVCNLVRDVRFRRVGPNPFVSVIALSGGMDRQQAPLVLDSGTDDILLSPASANVFRTRLSRLVRARKPFVGTPNYVGPDRRNAERALDPDVPLIDAPNALRAKALGITEEPIAASIVRTYRAIGCQQVGRMGVTVRTVATDLKSRLAPESKDAARARLAQLSDELTALTAHMAEQGYDDLVDMLELTKSALGATMEADELNPKRLEVLGLHGDSLIAMLRSGGKPHDQLETGLQKAVVSVGRAATIGAPVHMAA